MNYAYLIGRLPNEVKLRIEREAVLAAWLHQGKPLQALLTDPAVVETIANRLSRSERRVMVTIVTQFGCEPFDLAKLERLAAAQLSGAEARVGFYGLLQKALVFAFRKTWGEQVYVMPSDGLLVWQRVLFPALDGTEDAVIQATLSSSMTLSQELFFLLVQAAQQGLKLTKSGTLHKKQILKLSELLSMPEDWFKGLGLKYAYGDVYPLPLAVALDMLLRLQLLEQHEDELVLKEERCGLWMQLRAEEQRAVLYETWKMLTQPSSVSLQHSVLLLERLPAGKWLSWKALAQWLEEQRISSELPERELEEAWQREWVLPLLAFGWLEQGTDTAGVQHYRWLHHPREVEASEAGQETQETQESQETACLMVQPDFDLLIPPDVPQSIVWEVACFADCTSKDQLSVYKLSKESLRRALEQGRKGEELLALLEKYAMYGVPDNVRLTVEQWTKPFGRIGFEQVLLLRCAEEETGDALTRLSGTSGLLGERLGDRHFIVRPEAWKSLSTVLEKAGFMAGKPLLLDGSNEKEGGTYPCFLSGKPGGERLPLPWQASEKGIIYSRHNVMYFEMERRVPELSELYPDLHHIPPQWLKEYRSYHASTRREMVEKAIEWKTMLQVRKDGADYWVAPRKLLETRGTWSMSGRGRLPNGRPEAGEPDEVQWLAEEWQEMKLILPGINDKF
jgi:hypothetical protein